MERQDTFLQTLWRWPKPPKEGTSLAILAVVGAGGVLGAKVSGPGSQLATDDQIYAFTHGTTPRIAAADSPRVAWQPLDFTDFLAPVAPLTAVHPDVVINCAAMTNVDACERGAKRHMRPMPPPPSI